MSQRYRSAQKGKKFVLTAFGLEHREVRIKLEENSAFKPKFEKKCPRTWVESGYVMEVDV